MILATCGEYIKGSWLPLLSFKGRYELAWGVMYSGMPPLRCNPLGQGTTPRPEQSALWSL